MNNKISKVQLTIKLEGGRLIRQAEYESAKIVVKNRYSENEIVEILVPMREKSPRIEVSATKQIILGKEFIENALKTPADAFLNKQFMSLKAATKKWQHQSEALKIALHCQDLAEAMGGKLIDVELIN